ncbi:MAG: hypothetical protein NZM25_09165 [Leptospiraceae bacterium]|nr:hypothetical protein [Leptospiraceae bacterium]MDW8307309.1 hypothetical protein [Leptospiraceae bacterium]
MKLVAIGGVVFLTALWASTLRLQLQSLDPRQRESALRQLMQNPTQENVEILQEHLLQERNKKVLRSLLEFFRQRKARADFFYLLDFIGMAEDPLLALEAAKILKEIHLERARKELLDLSSRSLFYFYLYLKTFAQNTSQEWEQVKKALESEALKLAILSLPEQKRDEIIEAILPFEPYDLLLPTEGAADIILRTLLLEKKGLEVDPSWFNATLDKDVPHFVRKLFFEKRGKYFFDSFMKEEVDTLLGDEVFRWYLWQDRRFPDEYYTKAIRYAQSSQEVLFLLLYFPYLSQRHKEIFCEKKLAKNLPLSWHRRHKFLCQGEFSYGDFSNVRLYIRNLPRENTAQAYLMLRSGDARYRMKAYLSTPDEDVAQKRLLYKALWLQERDPLLRFYLEIKLQGASQDEP